jgi:hypothetical protein
MASKCENIKSGTTQTFSSKVIGHHIGVVEKRGTLNSHVFAY